MKCHSSNRHSRTCGAKKTRLREFFFFAAHVVRLCNLSHETFRNTRSKKKTRPCDFLAHRRAEDTTRHLRLEFRGHSRRRHHDAAKTTRGSALRTEFRRRSTRQRHDSPKTTRGSPFTPRISRTLHTPASRQGENNERVTTYALNFEDAPGASITTPQKPREGRHSRPEFRRRSTHRRHEAPKTTRGWPLTP